MGTRRLRITAPPVQRIGAHTSIAGGVCECFPRITQIGANAAQIFVKSNRQWFAPPLPSEEAAQFRTMAKQSGHFLCGHSGYLINLGAPLAKNFRTSIDSMVAELHRAEALGLPLLVMHPGSHGGKGEQAGLKRILEGIEECLAQTKNCHVRIALETTAGQGTSLGSKWEHLAWLLDHTSTPKRLSICMDTAHIFEAGFDIRTPQGLDATIDSFDQTIGLQHLDLIHCNDSKTPLGSRVDRHEHLGKGHIGLPAFHALMQDPRLAAIPKILETPKSEDLHEDIENLCLLKQAAA